MKGGEGIEADGVRSVQPDLKALTYNWFHELEIKHDSDLSAVA